MAPQNAYSLDLCINFIGKLLKIATQIAIEAFCVA